jgi:shikimate dehydrogenase
MGVPYAEVIGDPIAHSKSPIIHKFWLEKLGMKGDYRATRVTSKTLNTYLRERSADPDWRGCNVTMPLKQMVAERLPNLMADARKIGAANTIVPAQGRPTGYNTDAPGFMEPLNELLGPGALKGKDAIIVGAGGAALAIAVALVGEGARLCIANRHRNRAREVADRAVGISSFAIGTPSLLQLRELWLGPPPHQPKNLALLVNATSLGMVGQPPLDVRFDTAPKSLIVYDLVYDPLVTPLLKEARDQGLRTIDGLEMLVAQARRAFRLFFGAHAPRQHDAELRKLLTR